MKYKTEKNVLNQNSHVSTSFVPVKTSARKKNITGLRPLAKNENFDIDTSFKTGEGTAGYIVSLKYSKINPLNVSQNPTIMHILNIGDQNTSSESQHSSRPAETYGFRETKINPPSPDTYRGPHVFFSEPFMAREKNPPGGPDLRDFFPSAPQGQRKKKRSGPPAINNILRSLRSAQIDGGPPLSQWSPQGLRGIGKTGEHRFFF